MKIYSREAQLQNLSGKEKAKIEKIKEDVKRYGDRLKLTVDEQVTKILNDLDQTANKLSETIEKNSQSLTKAKVVLNKEVKVVDEGCYKFLQSCHVNDRVFKASTCFENRKNVQTRPRICPTDADQYTCRRGHSYLVTTCFEGKIEASVIEAHTTDLMEIYNILPYRNGKFLIGSYDDSVLYFTQIRDNKFEIIKKRSQKVWGMAVFSPDTALLAQNDTSLTNLTLTDDSLYRSVFHVSLSKAIAVHVDCRVIIGACNDERNAVQVLYDKGREDVVYEFDKNQQPIFTFPRKLTCKSNGGHIYVIDYTANECECRVIVPARNGDIINRYTGNIKMNKQYPFRPSDIVTSPKDYVIVADAQSKGLHVLDNTEQLLKFIHTRHFQTEGNHASTLTGFP